MYIIKNQNKRKITQDKIWIQTPLSIPATKRDVIQLFKDLEKRLESLGARESGICLLRDQIYGECFDETVRQVTINFKKRGVNKSHSFLSIKYSPKLQKTL